MPRPTCFLSFKGVFGLRGKPDAEEVEQMKECRDPIFKNQKRDKVWGITQLTKNKDVG